MILCGYKEMAEELQRIWGVPVSPKSVYAYSKSVANPMPVRRIGPPARKVYCYKEELESWAKRILTEASVQSAIKQHLR